MLIDDNANVVTCTDVSTERMTSKNGSTQGAEHETKEFQFEKYKFSSSIPKNVLGSMSFKSDI